MIRWIPIIVVTLVLVTLCAGIVEAVDEPGRAAQYYVQPGSISQLQINVKIWGQVLRPGLYLVPDQTDLVDLLSYAGGPTDVANLVEVVIVRNTSEQSDIIKVNIKKYLIDGDIDDIPILMPGDTVVVSGSIFHAFDKFAGFLAKLAVIVTTYNLFFGA